MKYPERKFVWIINAPMNMCTNEWAKKPLYNDLIPPSLHNLFTASLTFYVLLCIIGAFGSDVCICLITTKKGYVKIWESNVDNIKL